MDSIAVNLILKVERIIYPDTKFEISKCKAKTMLEIHAEEGDEYGMENPEKSIVSEINRLKENGIWQKLDME